MKLFFGVCAQRSGSTLLTRILNAHSKIAAPFEIPMASYAFGSGDQNISIDKIIQISALVGVEPALAVKDPQAFFKAILAYEGKDALVVKEPMISVHLPRVFLDFGDVPIIHIVRDVRQVSQSKSLLQLHNGSVPHAMRHWFNHNYEILKYGRHFSQVRTVRYEDLVAAPEQTMRSLMEFMGYDFEPDMLDYWKKAHSDDKLQLWDGRKPTDTTWAKDLYQNEIKDQYKEPPEAVVKVYEANPRLKALNERFGYK